MDAIVLRALARVNRELIEAPTRGHGIHDAPYWQRRTRQSHKFHAYLVRKLDEGKDAQAEVKRLKRRLMKSRRRCDRI